MKQSYSKEEWNQMIQTYRNSGEGLTKWCKEHDVSVYAMKYRMYYKHNKKNQDDDIRFVPLVIDEHNDSVITITVGNASIDVDQDTDLTLLKNILEALQ